MPNGLNWKTGTTDKTETLTNGTGIDRNDLRSQSLDLLRFPLAVIIIINHTIFIPARILESQGTGSFADAMPVYSAIQNFVSSFLQGQSVPIYFFISGFVFFLGADLTKKVYVRKLKNRVHTLLIPYILWNSLDILLRLVCFLPFLAFLSPGTHSESLDFSFSAILQSYWDASKGIFGSTAQAGFPSNIPLWFVRNLMVVVLFAPVLHWLLKKTRYGIVLLLGIFWVLSVCLHGPDRYAVAFFFFTWGGYMSVNSKEMLAEFGRFSKASIIGYLVIGSSLCLISNKDFPQLWTILKTLNILVGLFCAYNLAAWLLKNKICKVSRFLASSSFFLYVAHELICGTILKILFHGLRPTSDAGICFICFLAVGLTVGSLLLSFYLLKRYIPGLLTVLTGRK